MFTFVFRGHMLTNSWHVLPCGPLTEIMDLKERRNLLLKDLSEQGCSTTEQRDILRGITGERLRLVGITQYWYKIAVPISCFSRWIPWWPVIYFTLTVSMRQVQRINRKKGICRKPQEESPLEEIERAILVNYSCIVYTDCCGRDQHEQYNSR